MSTSEDLVATPPSELPVGGAREPRVGWFVVRFLVVLFVCFNAYTLTKTSQAFEEHRELLAIATSWVLGLGYENVLRAGTILSMPGQAGVDVGEGCDAIFPILTFVGGVLAFSSTWRAKLVGLVGGLALIELLNIVRIASLFVIQRHRPEWFHAAHTKVWETIFVLFSVTLWALWAMRSQRGRAA